MTEVQDKDVRVDLLRRLEPLLERLRPIGTERDTARNRQLFFDDYVKLVVLYLTNPLIDSLAMLQRAAALPKLAKQLGIKRFSKASFSEAPAVFEPEALQGVIDELAGQLQMLPKDPRLAEVKQVITLADGTLLKALPKLVETLYNAKRPNLSNVRCVAGLTLEQAKSDAGSYHAWRVHAQLDLERFVPSLTRLTGGSPRGAANERRVLEATAQPGRMYVVDRGYFDKPMLDRVVTAVGSSYVLRAPDDLKYQVVQERELSQAALDQGVIRDAVVRLEGMEHTTRLVVVEAEVHAKRTRKGYVPSSGQMLLLCNEMELPPEVVSLVYRYRWTIETFFKFLKQLLGCRHLINQRKAGVQIQVYCAVIVCMLLNLATGLRPAKAVMERITWYLLGFADLTDVQDQIQRTRAEQEKARAKKLAR